MKIYYRYKKFLVGLRKNQKKHFHLELTSFGDLDERLSKLLGD